MRTVAFETSSAHGGVAVGQDGRLVAEEVFAQPLVHARRLVPALEALLERAGWERSQIERVAVSIGPGSFTGLRIGLATAKVLARELSARLVGVGSLDVLAARAPFAGPFGVVVDARRDSVYWRRYEGGGVPPRASGPFEVLAPRELAGRLDPGLPLLGTGALAYRTLWPAHPLAGEDESRPRPSAVLALADQGEPIDPLGATPVYGLSGVRSAAP